MLPQVKQTLRDVRLYHSAKELETVIEFAKNNDLSFLDFLDELLKFETTCRRKNKIKRHEKFANFPCIKTIDEFDFRFQTSVSKKDINEWLTFSWLDNRENKILMGAPGVGKTHLALGIGFSAVHKGYRVLFKSMQTLMEDMIIADRGGEFNSYLKKLHLFDLIIIDELGYLPLANACGNLFFQFINHCYENKSLMITSNKMCSEWDTFFGDRTIAAAILDRLLHHSESIYLDGDSYRLKNIDKKNK